jgi:hypothetical protein
LVDDDMLRGLLDERSPARGPRRAVRHGVAEHDDAVGESREPEASVEHDDLMSRLF